MGETPHSFWTQKLREELVAAILDEFYMSRAIVRDIQHVKVEFQLLAGIDRVMTLRGGTRNTYEDKADFRASMTGNLFIETWSKKDKVRGWSYTCGAQYIDFFIAEHRTILVGETLRLKERVREWERLKHYPQREAVNTNYTTVGIVVPIPVVVGEVGLMALDVPEDVVKAGIARYASKAASHAAGIVIDERVALAVGEEWDYARAIIGAEPKGRINGIPYGTPAELSAILENTPQVDAVCAVLERNGEISETQFARDLGGARLAPVIQQIRAERGWVIENDPARRSYRLVSGAPMSPPALPLFETVRG